MNLRCQLGRPVRPLLRRGSKALKDLRLPSTVQAEFDLDLGIQLPVASILAPSHAPQGDVASSRKPEVELGDEAGILLLKNSQCQAEFSEFSGGAPCGELCCRSSGA